MAFLHREVAKLYWELKRKNNRKAKLGSKPPLGERHETSVQSNLRLDDSIKIWTNAWELIICYEERHY
jgi:hypothetical protein